MAESALGRLDEGLRDIVAALDADPLSMTANQDYGRILYLSRRYDEAVVQLQHTLEIAPHVRWARVFLGLAYVQLEAYDDALAVLEFHAPLAAFVRGRAGDLSSARRLLNGSMSDELESTWAGLLHLSVGEIDSAMLRLRDARRDHELPILELCPKIQPLFDPLRSHPQFEELLPR